ncbi:(E2-independent) E3 ubiquitin-conjugating enzyme FATS [Pezoporus wallicus]|uniref:(E2-independent) E3 ubiquitin-conjugating enzyme FATS n=1 Tax=Pezoporus wallicus TaxID=35540 RepID=UPI00254C94A2|nr:(E2-independent) E3 ubiquitin-conjugating enzyme FATS [Pezoporus wallicus]
MLMRGGGRHELFMPLQPEQADPGFSCYHCNKWQLAQPCSGHSASQESTEMPSGERKPPCPRCAQSSRVDFQVKPYAKWTREAQSFVTRMFLTINYSSWKKTGCFGGTQKQWSPDGQRTCTGLRRQSAAESKPSSTKESLSSQNATISPIVISQMIDENKSKENWTILPMLSMIPQPSAYHTKESLAKHGAVNINRAFMVLPSRIEIQASLGDTTSPLESPITEGKQCPNQQKGFASITITARRVAAGFSDPAHGSGAVQEPNAVSPTSSKVPAESLHCWPPHGHTKHHTSPLKMSKSCSQVSKEPPKQLFDSGNKNSVDLQSSDGRQKVPPSFISCVHLQVSQWCPNTIYYLDKSLNVCIDQPQIKCQKIHRSALSLNINCSLSRLTADGVDGIANGEPIEEIFQTKLLGENKTPLRSNLSADLTENNGINKEKTHGGYLGSKYPVQSVFVSELPAFVDTPRGPNNVVTAKEDDGTLMLSGNKKNQCTTGGSSTTDSGCLPDTASTKAVAVASDGSLRKRNPAKGTSRSKEIQAQGILKPKNSVSRSLCNITASSRTPLEENIHRENQLLKSDYEFHGSSDKLKEREEEDEQEGASRVTLSMAHSPHATHGQSDALRQPEASSQSEKHPPAPRTLREALEIHKPQFICRSRERLKRLEEMVQLRKAQQRETPSTNQGAPPRKSASTSTSSRRKQFTVPHPLSDNLFKPKERFIPEKEMHMRSKRIYDNLPEVKKKQEEKQKRIIIQSNKLRVENFKKQLLDQLLQRNTE